MEHSFEDLLEEGVDFDLPSLPDPFNDDLLSLDSGGQHGNTDSEFELVGQQTVVVVPDINDPDEEDHGAQVLQPVVTGSAWEHIMSQSFFSAVNPSDALALPWETGPMRDIFSPKALPATAKVSGDSTNLKLLQVEEAKPVVGHSDGAYASSSMPAYMTAVQNLKDTEYMENKRARTGLAVAKWMDILSVCWSCSPVGTQLKLDLQLDPTGCDAEATLRSVFGVKSPTTLLKRAASMNQYMNWFAKALHHTSSARAPLPLKESDVWAYFQHLKENRILNNKGFTVSSTFLETVRFCKHVVGMDSCDAILASKRLFGFAALEKQHKGPMKQAPPLEAEHLLALHKILEHGENRVDRIGAGCFLVAIYARARWSDLRFVHHVKYDGYKRNATFDIYTAEHKTSSVGLRRQQFLPLVVPAEGIGGGDWLGTWIKLMKDAGCDWERVPLGPLLPAPKGEDGWFARPLSTNEAAVWLRKLLEGLPRADEIRAHSMKTTLCVWTARAGFSKEHRAILSRHSSALHGSDVVYSRDLQTGAILRLMLLRKIRLGLAGDSELNEAQKKITSAFDSGLVSAVRTPVLDLTCPGTPGGAKGHTVDVTLQRSGPEQVFGDEVQKDRSFVAANLEEGIKVEEDFEEQCVPESVNFSIFTVQELSGGLIEIDSSSGSSSEPSESGSDSSDDVGGNLDDFKDRAFVEEVPPGEEYFAHKKSGVMHRVKSGSRAFNCKLQPGKNHEKVALRFFFKYPKCSKCFAERHKGAGLAEDDSAEFNRAFKKMKAR